MASVPAPFVSRSVLAASSSSTARDTRPAISRVGKSRVRMSTGSMQVRMRVPDSWISTSSFECSRNMTSTTMSACLSASTAAGFRASGVAPTVQTPTSPPMPSVASGNRIWNPFAPSRAAAARKAAA